MRKWIKGNLFMALLAVLYLLVVSCKERPSDATETITLNENSANVSKSPNKELTQEFKDYWYSGEAEITSYSLEQPRYGELRKGHAVLIYVTEPFNPDKQVKADRPDSNSISVLKLNSTKKYLTGIYPYSIMTSTFFPLTGNPHALKVSFSAQEWCGQVYAQLNNRENLEVLSHSYFESEGDQRFTLDKTLLENELWTMIRTNPQDLPVGNHQIVPSLEFIRLSHKELKAYNVSLTLNKGDEVSTYTMVYPNLERTLEINFSTAFPHAIESWTESFTSGFGEKAQTLVSQAKRIKSIKSPYWQKNGNEHVFLRDSLGI